MDVVTKIEQISQNISACKLIRFGHGGSGCGLEILAAEELFFHKETDPEGPAGFLLVVSRSHKFNYSIELQ